MPVTLKNAFHILGLLLFALSTIGCATVGSLAIPIRPAPARSFPEPPPAMIRIPVTMTLPIAGLLGDSNDSFLTGNPGKDFSRLIHLTGGIFTQAWKDPIQMRVTRDTLSLGLKVHYWVVDQALGVARKGADLVKAVFPMKGKTEEAMARVQAILQWDKSWHLESRLIFPSPEDKSANQKQVDDLFNHMGLDRMKKNAENFGRGLKDVSNLQPRAKEVWLSIQEPIQLEKHIWLLIRPEKVSVQKPALNPLKPQILETVFEMTARPEILFGIKPEVIKLPLPPLLPYQKGPGGFHALSNVRISYWESTQLMKDLRMGIFGHVFKETGDRKLTIVGLRLYGSGGKVVAEVRMQYEPILNLGGKPAEMMVYLMGTPRYLKKQRMFDLPDLDFDIKSSDFLVEVAQWFFKDSLKKQLRQKARIPMGPKLDRLKERMDQIFNLALSPTTRLTTVVEDLSVLDAYADNEGLVARVALDGRADLHVVWK
jgi:hypothetical protein